MKRAVAYVIALVWAVAAGHADPSIAPAPDASDSEPFKKAWLLLDELHYAASIANGERYFAVFAPDAVFLGTDATERWPLDEFRSYAMKRFATGTGWTYTLRPSTRHIQVAGEIAWFDELLDNAKYGVCRGSGVLRKVEGRWLIAQYNLTLTIPNEVAADVAARIREHEAATKATR